MPRVFLLLMTLCLICPLQAQKNPALNNITLYKGSKRVNLNRYNEFHLVYHKTSQGYDSISTEVFCKEIRLRHDSLFVRPTDLTTFRLMDPSRPYTESKYYPNSTNTWLVIPAGELEYIKAKRQPIQKISSTILSISYITLLCSPFIAMSQNQSVSDFGVGLFLVSVPVLAVSFSTNAIWGKKKFRLDETRTRKTIWRIAN